MLDVMKGGSVSVAQYRSHAIRACSASNVEQPWACIDLVYVVALLQDAYKIPDDKPISVSIIYAINIVYNKMILLYLIITFIFYYSFTQSSNMPLSEKKSYGFYWLTPLTVQFGEYWRI